MGYNIFSFSVKSEDIPFVEKLEALGKPDSKDRSAMIVTAIKEYVERHSPGNPNLTFNSEGNLVYPQAALEKKKALACSRCGEKATRVYFLKHGGHVLVCDQHKIGKQQGVQGFRKL